MTSKATTYACTECFVLYHLFEEDIAEGAPTCDYCGRQLVRAGERNGRRKS